jgi:ribosomal-protein-alanine N-acetyltransferase
MMIIGQWIALFFCINNIDVECCYLITIRPVSQHDLEMWQNLRQILRPEVPAEQQILEMQHYFQYWDVAHVFVAETANETGPIGFIEVTLRDRAEQAVSSPVAYIESSFVRPEYRKKGACQLLVKSVEDWAIKKGCTELATDAPVETGEAFEHLGFEKVKNLNHYLKHIAEKPKKIGVKLETERLIVREAQFGDEQSIVNYLTENRVFHLPFEAPRPGDYYTLPYWTQRIYSTHYKPDEDRNLQLFIFSKVDPGLVLGYANYYNIMYGAFYACHVGYMLAEFAQGTGVMQEALRVGIDYMFRARRMHRIMANYMPKNKRSGKTLKNLGFVQEGVAKKFLYVNGKWEDHILTSLTNKNW